MNKPCILAPFSSIAELDLIRLAPLQINKD